MHNTLSPSSPRPLIHLPTLKLARVKLLSQSNGSAVGGSTVPLPFPSDGRGTAWSFLRALVHDEVLNWKDQSLLKLLTVVIFGFFTAQAIAGILSAKVTPNRIRLSSPKRCGAWQFDENAGGEAADVDDLSSYRNLVQVNTPTIATNLPN